MNSDTGVDFPDGEMKFRKIFDESPVGTVMVGLDNKFMQCNAAFCRFLGYKEEELIGKCFLEVTYSEDIALGGSEMKRMLNGELDSARFQKRYLTKNGEIVWGDINITLLRDASNRPLFFLPIVQDITELKSAEQALGACRGNVKEIEQFTYIASHDLQEPLRTLITFSQLLHDEFDNKLEGDGNRYIDFIQQSATRMSSLVSGLLDYTLIGKTCERSLVDMNDVLRIALENLDAIIEESKAVVSWGSLYSLNGYRIELRQLLQQLISNAIKFKRKDHIPEIRISMHKLSHEWLFTVEDNGIGIEEKDREKVFTIFKRVHNRKEIEGTGIGLAHCKKIVELHHGLIWVEPNTSEGSAIKFTIPLK
jgi:PAS domain S-box-containing protein